MSVETLPKRLRLKCHYNGEIRTVHLQNQDNTFSS